MNVGDKIKIFPEGRETTVIEFAHWQERDKKFSAEAGECVGIIIADEFITRANDSPPKISNRLRASVFRLGKNFLTVDKSYKIKLARVNSATLQRQENSSALKLNDVGEIIFKFKKKLPSTNSKHFKRRGDSFLWTAATLRAAALFLRLKLLKLTERFSPTAS